LISGRPGYRPNQNCPQKRKKDEEIFMFEEFSVGLEASPGDSKSFERYEDFQDVF
jgi:hypothetical protein